MKYTARFEYDGIHVEATADDVDQYGKTIGLEIRYLTEDGDDLEWEKWPKYLDQIHNEIEYQAKEELYARKYSPEFYVGAW